jgi:hypothetical protein
MRSRLSGDRQRYPKNRKAMKKTKAKATLANLKGLDALRLAREPKPKPEQPIAREPKPKPKQPKSARSQSTREIAAPEAQPRSVGRPRTGKRSNQEYRGITVYIKRKTHADVDDLLRKRRRAGLLSPGEPEDVSELVEQLLSEWYQQQGEE